MPQAATHGGGPSAASRGTACAVLLSWSRPAAWPLPVLVTGPVSPDPSRANPVDAPAGARARCGAWGRPSTAWKGLPAPHHSQARGGTLQAGRPAQGTVGVLWPGELVDLPATGHRVIRHDHRDTGRSSAVFGRAPYAVRDLAADAVAVLDGPGVDRAHVAGMSMGGTLVQLLPLDAPARLRRATVFCTSALGAGPTDVAGTGDLPGPAPELLEYWQTIGADRDRAAELATAKLLIARALRHTEPGSTA